MKITVKRLSSGYWHIRGVGPCNYSQPPWWPCSGETIREYAHPEAGREFVLAASALAIVTQPCGHPATEIVSSDEGTHHCAECERESRP